MLYEVITGVAISRPVADIYALWWHDFTIAAALLGFATSALGTGLFFYQRRLRHFLATEEKANLALAANERKLRTILDTEPECVMVTNEVGTVLQINRAGLALIEQEEEAQVIGQNIRTYLLPDYEEAFASLIEHVLAGDVATLDYEITGYKARRCWVCSRAAPMRDAGGTPTGMVIV